MEKTIGEFTFKDHFSSQDPMTRFLYVLMRDGCPAGVFEKAIKEMTGQETHYKNGWLAQYAENVAKRLIKQAGAYDTATFTRKASLLDD